jgi:hypothetical protein
MAGRSQTIKNAVIALLQGMGATSDGTKLKTVLDNTKGAFDGYPAAQVLPLNLGNATLTNRSKERTSAYAVLLHIPMEDTPESEAAAYNAMYDLVDLITDTFDTADLNGLNLGFVLRFDTTLADYQVAQMKNGVTLLVRMDISAMYTKDL